jgi:hypothetical protein
VTRCAHGFTKGLCVVFDCRHFDGHTGGAPFPTLRACRVCGEVVRGRGTADVHPECQQRVDARQREAQDV